MRARRTVIRPRLERVLHPATIRSRSLKPYLIVALQEFVSRPTRMPRSFPQKEGCRRASLCCDLGAEKFDAFFAISDHDFRTGTPRR